MSWANCFTNNFYKKANYQNLYDVHTNMDSFTALTKYYDLKALYLHSLHNGTGMTEKNCSRNESWENRARIQKTKLGRELTLFFVKKCSFVATLSSDLSFLWWCQYGGTVTKESCRFAFFEISRSFSRQPTSKMLFSQILVLILV